MSDLEYLNQYRAKAIETEALRRAMENLAERLGPRGLGAVRSGERGTNAPEAALLQHLDAYSEQYEENRKRLAELRPQLERIMQRAANSRDRAILMDFYGRGTRNEDIACTTGLSPRHILRIRRQFTQKLQEEAL